MKNYTTRSVAAIMSLTILLSACNQGSRVTEQDKASIINDIDGVYEYLPPGKGQSVNRNGRFVYLFGSPDGKSMTSQLVLISSLETPLRTPLPIAPILDKLVLYIGGR